MSAGRLKKKISKNNKRRVFLCLNFFLLSTAHQRNPSLRETTHTKKERNTNEEKKGGEGLVPPHPSLLILLFQVRVYFFYVYSSLEKKSFCCCLLSSSLLLPWFVMHTKTATTKKHKQANKRERSTRLANELLVEVVALRQVLRIPCAALHQLHQLWTVGG